MTTIVEKYPDGSVLSVDELGNKRHTALTVYNMCKNVGFPQFKNKYGYVLEAYTNQEITDHEYLNYLLDMLQTN